MSEWLSVPVDIRNLFHPYLGLLLHAIHPTSSCTCLSSGKMKLDMDHPVDKILSLAMGASPIKEATWKMIKWLDYLLTQDPSIINNLAGILKEYREQLPEPLQEIPPDIADTILKAIIDVLEDEYSIPILIEKLGPHGQGYGACIILGWFGPRARQAIPRLIDLADGSLTVGVAQDTALRIGGNLWPMIAKNLRIFLDAEDDGLSFLNFGVFAVRAGYSTQPDFMDIMKRAAQNNEVEIRCSVPNIIGAMKTTEREAFLPILRQLENDPSDLVREEVLRVIMNRKNACHRNE